jgi:hypothetical protein
MAADGPAQMDPAGKRLIAEMPLHAITSVYGEAGLRERMLAETAQFPAADLARARAALALASRLHLVPGTGRPLHRDGLRPRRTVRRRTGGPVDIMTRAYHGSSDATRAAHMRG